MSAIASILVHLDDAASSAARLRLAVDVAGRLGAALTVLYGPRAASGGLGAHGAGPSSREDESTLRRETHARHERALQALLPPNGPGIAWSSVPPALVGEGVLREAAFADLLVLGAHEPVDADLGLPPALLVDGVVLQSGRPALVVPASGPAPAIGGRALVAWDGSPQAARAVSAALPLLREAASVELVGWGDCRFEAPFSGLGIGRYLERHGIAATLRAMPATRDVGRALAEHAASIPVQLVVMGCYGHAPLRERVFGGATRRMLLAMPAPLLLAH